MKPGEEAATLEKATLKILSSDFIEKWETISKKSEGKKQELKH